MAERERWSPPIGSGGIRPVDVSWEHSLSGRLVSRRLPVLSCNHGGRDGVAQGANQRQHASSVHRPAGLLRREAGEDGEGKNGTIELMEPLDEEISGIVEVVGRVTAKATIMCASYVQFKEDNHPFDLGLYNEAVKITHEFPQFFPLGVVQYG
uniref:Uncharacterized protein n=1 Tax=Ovis aries TaxID=9940 RepID=A0AC11ANY8_SHEEP